MKITNLKELEEYVKSNGIINTINFLMNLIPSEKESIKFAYSSGYVNISLLNYLLVN